MNPVRTCIACRNKDDKKNYIRIVSGNDRVPVLDEKMKENKRGIYICKNHKCVEKCINMINKNKLIVKIDVDYKYLKDLLEKIDSDLSL